MPQRLPTPLAQLKGGNVSENLLNETQRTQRIIYSLYQTEHGSLYNMTNIFRVSHILKTFFTSL